MKNKNNIILIFIFFFLNTKLCCQPLYNNFLIKKYALYKECKKQLKEKKFDNAISILEEIKKNNIANFRNDKIQINLIYAYYENLNFNMAEKIIQEFIQCHPNHPNMDYVIYIQCLINMNMDKNILSNLLPIKYYKNDPKYAINAFFKLKNLVQMYPESLYVVNAKKNLIYLKNRLSENDFKILKFYFLNKEYIAVVNRGEEILQKYSDTLAARKALIYIEKSYIALKIFDAAQKISKIISLNKL